MEDPAGRRNLLLDLETRHDELLQRLEDLEREVEKVLHDWLGPEAVVEAETAPAMPRFPEASDLPRAKAA